MFPIAKIDSLRPNCQKFPRSPAVAHLPRKLRGSEPARLLASPRRANCKLIFGYLQKK